MTVAETTGGVWWPSAVWIRGTYLETMGGPRTMESMGFESLDRAVVRWDDIEVKEWWGCRWESDAYGGATLRWKELNRDEWDGVDMLGMVP